VHTPLPLLKKSTRGIGARLAAIAACLALQAFAASGITLSGFPLTDDEPPSLKSVVERFEIGRQLARNGNHARALVEFLWCYDVGMVEFGAFRSIRLNFLLNEIKRLGLDYPPALEAMRARCDAAENRLMSDPTDDTAGPEFVALSEKLGKERRIFAIFEKLPRGDARRGTFGPKISTMLLEKRRYDEAAEIRPFPQMKQQFEASRRNRVGSAFFEEKRRERVVAATLDDIEVLVGARDDTNARELIALLFELNSSAPVQKQLAARLRRAGQPTFLADVGLKR
jgi:hypothetical protein